MGEAEWTMTRDEDEMESSLGGGAAAMATTATTVLLAFRVCQNPNPVHASFRRRRAPSATRRAASAGGCARRGVRAPADGTGEALGWPWLWLAVCCAREAAAGGNAGKTACMVEAGSTLPGAGAPGPRAPPA